MKIFTKRLTLVMGLLFTALICMGIVYIDTVQNYWYVNGGFVKLVVSNQTAQAVMTVDTNTMRVGFNTNNIARSFVVVGQKPATNATGNGTTAVTTGIVQLQGGAGGESTLTTSASGGSGGPANLQGGLGGSALAATTNATGGTGGAVNLTAGNGGAGSTSAGAATNAATGGTGGGINVTSGNGGGPSAAATNTVGGAGGTYSMTSGAGGIPVAGWTRKGGDAGSFNIIGGLGGSGVDTNGGSGGAVNITAGTSGAATGVGNPQPGASVSTTGGAGSTGTTNSDGGHVFIAGGAPGTGAVPGNVVLARTSAGTSRGAGVQIGPFISGGTATVTNMLGAAASLDFPSTAAGSFSELTISVTGVTSNNVAVALSVPWESAQTGGAFVTFNSNDVIYVRFINNQLVAAIDPTPGTFIVVGFRIR